MILDTRFLRDFSVIDVQTVMMSDACEPFLWLVRECGTTLCKLAPKADTASILYTMEQYRDECCLFHYDGCYLRPITPAAAHEMLDKLQKHK